MRRPHVAFPDQLPPQYLQMVNYTEDKQIPIDSEGWNTITDAMADVVNPVGYGTKRAPERHRLRGQDRFGANHFQCYEGQGGQQGGIQG